MVSTDMVVQASAALIAAVAFLVSVRQTLTPPVSSRFVKAAAGTMGLFVATIAVTVFEDLIPSEWHFEKWATWILFVAGLLALVFLVYRLTREVNVTRDTGLPMKPASDGERPPPGSEQGQKPKPEQRADSASHTEKERLRATLVLGLMAAIIALKIFQSSSSMFGWVSTVFSVLLLYWGVYAGATVYGIFGDFSDTWSRRLKQFGHLSFKFPLYVAAAMIGPILWELSGILYVPGWSLMVVGILTIIFFVVSETRELLRQSKRMDYARRRGDWWIEFVILVSFLFLADYLARGGGM